MLSNTIFNLNFSLRYWLINAGGTTHAESWGAVSGATHAKHALTQRLEFMELQLDESKALTKQLKRAIQVAGTDNKDKSDITNMRLDSLENRTYYMERHILSGSTTI